MTTTKKKVKKAQAAEYSSDENVLALYLREISHIPLLSREEEIEAAKAAANGDMTARNRLVNANLRFVVNIAKKYQGMGLPLADVISEGNIGLVNAVDRYKVDMGYHFISYAVWWIRQSILKAIYEKSRMIRLPVNRTNELIQIEKARKVIGEHQNVEDEIQEIAGLLNMDKEHVEEMLNISRDMVSLEKPVYVDRCSSVLGDFIEDEQYATPDQIIVQGALKKDIESVLDTLDGKEAAIIRYRFGLGDNTPSSLKELSDRFNLTKERIRQIEKKALTRLQSISRMERLAAYVA
ncbi:MAG: RNA polymerase sigma factor RpoD/SigA [Treponema sp.]|nr:RNA polymerase sigma factor RpoD/SigA [Treponema sp.]